MNKLLVFLVFLPALLQAQPGNFVINGTITGLPDKSKVFITDPDSPTDTIASTISKQNTFTLKGSLPESKLYNISFVPVDKKGLLFIDNNIITIQGDINNTQKLNVSGSPAHASFLQFQQRFEPYFRRYAQLTEQANKTGVNDSLLKIYKGLVKEVGDAGESFASENRDKNISAFMWATIMQVVDSTDRVEKSFQSLTPNVQQSFYGKYLAGRIADTKIGKVGTAALDFTQADTTGNPVALSSFKGKYVLVDFWASWCGPCRQENPNLVVAFDKFKGKNFTVLGVSLDNNRDRWLKAIADDQLKWTHVSDLKYWQNEVALKYKIQSIPQNILVDPNGVIVARNLRGEELQEKLCQLLGCN
jgi:peroxiredoxin